MAYGGTVVFIGIFQQVPEAIAILQPLLAILFFICDHTTHDIFTRLFVASNWEFFIEPRDHEEKFLSPSNRGKGGAL